MVGVVSGDGIVGVANAEMTVDVGVNVVLPVSDAPGVARGVRVRVGVTVGVLKCVCVGVRVGVRVPEGVIEGAAGRGVCVGLRVRVNVTVDDGRTTVLSGLRGERRTTGEVVALGLGLESLKEGSINANINVNVSTSLYLSVEPRIAFLHTAHSSRSQ